jgi:hypothetical protein
VDRAQDAAHGRATRRPALDEAQPATNRRATRRPALDEAQSATIWRATRRTALDEARQPTRKTARPDRLEREAAGSVETVARQARWSSAWRPALAKQATRQQTVRAPRSTAPAQAPKRRTGSEVKWCRTWC